MKERREYETDEIDAIAFKKSNLTAKMPRAPRKAEKLGALGILAVRLLFLKAIDQRGFEFHRVLHDQQSVTETASPASLVSLYLLFMSLAV